MWTDFFDKIFLLNLGHRTDRLLEVTEQFDNYNIPFERVEAIYDSEQGARGLRDSVVYLFKKAIQNNWSNVLIFEDDAEVICDKEIFHETMDKVVEQIPQDYDLCFLGCQVTHSISHFHSPNLFPVTNAFSTHAVFYSLKGMKEMVDRMDYPIDNWMVKEIETKGHCYATYPFLVSQRDGVSDIGKNWISWKPFLEQRYEQRIAEYRRK